MSVVLILAALVTLKLRLSEVVRDVPWQICLAHGTAPGRIATKSLLVSIFHSLKQSNWTGNGTSPTRLKGQWEKGHVVDRRAASAGDLPERRVIVEPDRAAVMSRATPACPFLNDFDVVSPWDHDIQRLMTLLDEVL